MFDFNIINWYKTKEGYEFPAINIFNIDLYTFYTCFICIKYNLTFVD